MRTIGYASLFAAALLGTVGCFGGSSDIGQNPEDSGLTQPDDSGRTIVGTDDASVDSTVPGDAGAKSDTGQDAPADTASPIDAGKDVTVGPEAGSEAEADAGQDSGAAEAGVDAGVDAGMDAGADAGVDAGADAGVDAGADAGVDAGTDAGVDAGDDAGVDAAAMDAGVPTLTVSGGNNNKITLANGVPLYVGDTHAVWSYGGVTPVTYQNLPPELIGTVGNDTVNNGTVVSFTLTAPATCYLLRQVNWSSVSLVGWSQFATASYYFDGYNNGTYGTAIIYSQTFAAGSYGWSTFSGMYSCAAQ